MTSKVCTTKSRPKVIAPVAMTDQFDGPCTDEFHVKPTGSDEVVAARGVYRYGYGVIVSANWTLPLDCPPRFDTHEVEVVVRKGREGKA